MPQTPDKAKAYQKSLRAQRKKNGVCSVDGVGIPVRPNGVCQKCLDRGRTTLRDLKLRVITGYGGKCACCGMDTWEFLSVDHPNNDGAAERKTNKINSGSLYRKIIRENFPPQYQLMCYNCNIALGMFGYCPHNPAVRRRVAQRL